ncbi:MAG: RecQ family ATP-dependent DNA helicase [Gammaproteobacteria bacterium]|nr:RecQ family ATP-dependent DNA helicase [Gammaproteobacteria bacterium]
MKNNPSIDESLQQHFGFDHFNEGQREVIEYLMQGHSALAVFPTGGGKSLCYQLPALLLPGLTLVVSPLIALMKDQIDALVKRGIAAARLDSSLSATEYHEVLNQARSGTLRLLYVAPERFNNERFRATIERLPIALLAIDEAHCISEWGHNFRPDYLKLPEFSKRCGAKRVLTLTATATPTVQEDIRRAFDIAPKHAVCTGFYRPNLTVLTTTATHENRDQQLLTHLQDQPNGSTIVYVTLQHTAEEIAAHLAQAGFPARAYHAGMKSEQRSNTQDWFMNSDDGIVVATIAFGMGVDKSNIRYVYHYNLPKSLENFAQEIGRAGRDGLPSICETFVCANDLNVLENFIYGDTPSLVSLKSLVTELFSHEDEFSVSQYTLSSAHDIRPLVLRTLLTYLELDGYLKGGTPFYSTYQFKPLQSSHEILNRFEGERREFIASIFRQAQKAKIWFNIDLEQTAEAINTTRDRIIRALDYLSEKNLLEVKVSGLRNRYQRIKSPETTDALATDLHQRALQRENSEIKRLQQVLELTHHQSCQVNFLATHFGDQRDQPCGHCSWCLEGKTAEDIQHPAVAIDEGVWQQALDLQADTALLHDSHTLARFLCGITSPKLSRAKLTKSPLFGALSHVPFQQLLAHAVA